MDCKKGGFIHARHDNVRNLEASLLSEVCNDVAIEPRLMPVTEETFELRSSNFEDDSRLDVKARGFYRQGQVVFLMLELHILTQNQTNHNLQRKYSWNTNRKRRELTKEEY